MLNTNFKFHPVGQGSFYTGNFELYSSWHRNFNIVFDCGVLGDRNNINDAIKFFKNTLHRRKLDILFLSHLDDDHVNGITDLLNGIRCENIYLPYLTPFERLLVAIRHNPKDSDNLDDFINFIRSPHDYIFSIEGSEVGKINYIKGNSEDTIPDEKPLGPIDPENPNIEFTDNLEILPSYEFNENEKMAYLVHNQKIVFKKANGKLKFGAIWEFFLFHEPGISPKIVAFLKSIEAIYDLKINEQLHQDDLNTILSNKDDLKELRTKFRLIFKNINKTGLIVQHKPLSYKSSYLIKKGKDYLNLDHYFNPFFKKFRSFQNSQNKPTSYDWGVTLLTGDICLDQIEISDYIRDHLNYVQVFQVPHHGSGNGWKKNSLKNLNHKGKTSAIINFGYGNTYGHPRPNVLQDLNDDNFDICFCNQFESFKYRINLIF